MEQANFHGGEEINSFLVFVFFFKHTMFTSEMESMLAMLMLIPTMTGGPEENGREKKRRQVTNRLKSSHKYNLWLSTYPALKIRQMAIASVTASRCVSPTVGVVVCFDFFFKKDRDL